ncbi:hypothetical protein LOTGIDRAFT_176784, partial [Lottia gigantea]
MDNPQLLPASYLQQPVDSPSSDNPENLRPTSSTPYKIPNVPSEGVNITVRLSPDGNPVPLSDVEAINTDNVKSIKVFVYDDTQKDYVPIEEVTGSTLTKKVLPDGVDTSKIKILVIPDNPDNPVEIKLKIHACFE